MTLNLFMSRARKVHGHKYNYSKVKFVDAQTKIEIICGRHNSFMQAPYAHLRGQGCPECAKERKIKRGSLVFSEFLEKAAGVHGDTYKYIEDSFSNAKSPMKIICSFHGEFIQKPTTHLRGSGCQKCAKQKSQLNIFNKKNPIKDTRDFIIRAKKVHGDTYCYKKSIYKAKDRKLIITCLVHGEFKQSPTSHLQGSGCSKCGVDRIKKANTKSVEQFIKEASVVHNNKYDYSESIYNGKNEIMKIICPIHGYFYQLASDHLYNGSGCQKCGIISSAKSSKYDTEHFIKLSRKVHGDTYSYKKSIYVKSNKKIEIICNTHGSFFQTPNKHLLGMGCPKCGRNTSILSQKWLDELEIPLKNREIAIKLQNGKKYRVDAYFDEKVYEFNGDFWHGNPKVYESSDMNPVTKKSFGELYNNTIKKENELRKFGFEVISMWEYDYKEKICQEDC